MCLSCTGILVTSFILFCLQLQWTCAIRHLSFPTSCYIRYDPKVFLLTKIKPEYSDILYNPTHFLGPLVCQIRQIPLYLSVLMLVFYDDHIMLHICIIHLLFFAGSVDQQFIEVKCENYCQIRKIDYLSHWEILYQLP